MKSLPRIVAVVEDDPSMRRSIERLLGAYGYETEGYASAETFLDRDFASEIGCLVLDIHLGDMSGIQLRRQLRESNSPVPVIFVTAADDKALETDAFEAGCLAYLIKPFAGKLLLSAVHQAMSGTSTTEDDERTR